MKLICVLALALAAGMGFAQNVIVNGNPVAFDARPRLINGTFMVPVRNLFEAMGVDFRWRMDRQVIEGLYKGTKIEIWVTSKEARVNDKRQVMDGAPFVWQGRTYAPLKFLAESLHFDISTENGNYVLRESR